MAGILMLSRTTIFHFAIFANIRGGFASGNLLRSGGWHMPAALQATMLGALVVSFGVLGSGPGIRGRGKALAARTA